MVGMLHRKIIRPLQEIYQDDLENVSMLYLIKSNKRQQVDEVRHKLFTKYPTEYDMMEVDEDELAQILQPGLYKRRAQKTLIKFSWQWVNGFSDVMELQGVGQYAKDSWELFQMNNTDIKPIR